MSFPDRETDCTRTSSQPFLFNPTTKSFISYDDPQSFALKGAYAKKAGLAGVNMFDSTGDTLDAALLKAVRSTFL